MDNLYGAGEIVAFDPRHLVVLAKGERGPAPTILAADDDLALRDGSTAPVSQWVLASMRQRSARPDLLEWIGHADAVALREAASAEMRTDVALRAVTGDDFFEGPAEGVSQAFHETARAAWLAASKTLNDLALRIAAEAEAAHEDLHRRNGGVR